MFWRLKSKAVGLVLFCSATAQATAVSAVSAGDLHTCAVANGGVQCWGNNSLGERGDSSAAISPIPLQTIAAGSNATEVSAGSLHTCAVVNGGVQCWGDSSNGRLGNNNAANGPIRVPAIAAGSNVESVSAGGVSSCAVVYGGLACWGFSGNYQLVFATSRSFLLPTPTQILIDPPVVSLSDVTVTFGSQNLGGKLTQTVTLVNRGDRPLNISDIVASGDFSVVDTCGARLEGGSACGVHVTFAPTAVGVRSGNALIMSDAAGSPHAINLKGTGVAGPPGAPTFIPGWRPSPMITTSSSTV